MTATFPPYWSGAGNVAWYGSRALAELGHDVHVFTAGPPGDRSGDAPGGRPADSLPSAPFHVHRLPAALRIGNAPLIPSLWGALRNFDVVHLHYPFIFGAELAAVRCTRDRIPLVVSYHNDLIAPGARGLAFSLYTRVVGRSVLRRAEAVLAVTLDHLRHSHAAFLLSCPRQKVHEVPNGVDPNLFRYRPEAAARARRTTGIPHDLPLALFVGTLDPAHHYRRLDVLMRAVAEVAASGEPVGLLVAGGGPLLPSYRQLATDLGIAGRTWFLGAVPHHSLAEVYSAAEVLVLPSQHQESFGMVAIEAMACERPVIASNLPGVRAVVRPSAGVLVPPCDPPALAQTLRALLSDPARRRALGRAGRELVEAEYTWPVVARRLDAVYQGVRH